MGILRAGGYVPVASRALPTYLRTYPDGSVRRESGLLPLGLVSTTAGPRFVGVPLDQTLFAFIAGASGSGKTTLSGVMALHLSTVEHMGIAFVDPTYGAVRRLKPYLAGAGPSVHKRVVEIDFSGLGGRPQPGWNLFDVAGLHPAQVVGRSSVIAEAFLAASGWDRTMAPRASNLLMQAAQSLTELSTILATRGREDIQPTVFQIVSILTKEDWRRVVTPHLSQPLRDFWQNRLEGFEKTAIPPATNLLDTMRHMPGIVNVLGQSKSAYNSRRAMDQGQIVLICTGPGEAGKLAANLVVFDALRAALSRADVPEAERRLFGIVLDELQRYDMREVSQILNELRQFGIRAIGVTQDPDRLEEDTLKALLTNASHLLIGRENPSAAGMFARQWSGAPQAVTLTKLPNHEFVGVVNLANGRQPPFRFRTPTLDEVFGDICREDLVAELDRAVRTNTRWQSADEVERHQRRLDEAIIQALSGVKVVPFPASRPDAEPPEEESAAAAMAGLQPLVIPDPEEVQA